MSTGVRFCAAKRGRFCVVNKWGVGREVVGFFLFVRRDRSSLRWLYLTIVVRFCELLSVFCFGRKVYYFWISIIKEKKIQKSLEKNWCTRGIIADVRFF